MRRRRRVIVNVMKQTCSTIRAAGRWWQRLASCTERQLECQTQGQGTYRITVLPGVLLVTLRAHNPRSDTEKIELIYQDRRQTLKKQMS